MNEQIPFRCDSVQVAVSDGPLWMQPPRSRGWVSHRETAK